MSLIVIRWIVLTFAILATAWILDGIQVANFVSAIFAAAALGLLNAFFRPIALLLTLPLNLVSLGLFTFLINALMLKMASGLIPGFHVKGFWTAVFGSILISIANWAITRLLNRPGGGGRAGRTDYIDLKNKGDDRWE